jgi:colicin V production protein
LVGKFLSKIVSVSGLSFLDRLGGFVMGSGKIFLTFSAVVAVISGTSLNNVIAPYFTNSKVYPVLLETGKWITNLDVKNIKNELDEMVVRPKDVNKTDVFISMDTNTSVNTDYNATKKGE